MKFCSPIVLVFLALPAFASSAKKIDLPQVELAYRNASSTDEGERRTVILQGSRQGLGEHFDTACGATGAGCECLFYLAANDSEPLRGTGLGIAGQNNALSCEIPGDHGVPDQVQYVSVRLRTGEALTGVIAIQQSLTLEQVLGGLDKSLVRGIFRYNCSRTFFEGEGVSQDSITCVAGQHLGVLTAPYSYYIYRSGVDSLPPSGDYAFPGDICGRNNFLHVQCTGNTPDLRFGFYKEAAGPFVVAVNMTADPAGNSYQYGFAALPDSAGHCPLGLVKARPWMAQPASITQGSLDGANPPSSFLNIGNSLSSTMVETGQPTPFAVIRQANQVSCDTTTGDCTNATFGSPTVAETAPYTPLTPVVCVIPQSLLGGLF